MKQKHVIQRIYSLALLMASRRISRGARSRPRSTRVFRKFASLFRRSYKSRGKKTLRRPAKLKMFRRVSRAVWRIIKHVTPARTFNSPSPNRIARARVYRFSSAIVHARSSTRSFSQLAARDSHKIPPVSPATHYSLMVIFARARARSRLA